MTEKLVPFLGEQGGATELPAGFAYLQLPLMSNVRFLGEAR